jgi:hypothetical protein
MRYSVAFLIVGATILMLSCGPKVMVPPKIDLAQHEVLGIIEFDCTHEGELGPFATRRFVEEARRDQGMVRVVELGPETEVLDAVAEDRLGPDAIKAIGEKYELTTLIIGELTVSDIKPDISITPGFGSMSFSANCDATLTVQMAETTSGASIWSVSGDATERIGGVNIFGGDHFMFDAEDPEKAYGKLVDKLVERTTKDFRVTWERK